MQAGIEDLEQVARQGTMANRAKAYHQLAQTYLKNKKNDRAEIMLDSMYTLLHQNDSPIYIHIDYQPILDHYLKSKNLQKAEQYVRMMLQEQQTFQKKRLNFNLIEAIVNLQTEKQRQELKIVQLGQANQRLWLLVVVVLSLITIAVVVVLLLYQKSRPFPWCPCF